MLSVADEYLHELNPESYAICKSDMLIKGQKPDNIAKGNSLRSKSDAKVKGDQFIDHKFDYLITNPLLSIHKE